MRDKYFLKKEKVADLLFDLVKYLLTTIGAIMLLQKEIYSFKALLISFVIAIIVFAVAVFIAPLKED
jgi:hypothetical protein